MAYGAKGKSLRANWTAFGKGTLSSGVDLFIEFAGGGAICLNCV